MDYNVFEYSSCWLRADFHLHTWVDKEFICKGEDNDYLNQYV
ncbi:MAG: hypothetical protein ACL7BU_14665 [Candidatus Phlomobacter fragariae]